MFKRLFESQISHERSQVKSAQQAQPNHCKRTERMHKRHPYVFESHVLHDLNWRVASRTSWATTCSSLICASLNITIIMEYGSTPNGGMA